MMWFQFKFNEMTESYRAKKKKWYRWKSFETIFTQLIKQKQNSVYIFLYLRVFVYAVEWSENILGAG